MATNPVKVYEYLSAGKPVVAVDLPETAQFGELVYRAQPRGVPRCGVRRALERAARRRGRACAGAPRVRARADLGAPGAADGRCDRQPARAARERGRARLQQPGAHQGLPGQHRSRATGPTSRSSSSTTPPATALREFLREWGAAGTVAARSSTTTTSVSPPGNNIGLAAATGEYLVLLNNDTRVTADWIRTLVNHLRRDPGIGIIGPVTNNIGNEARSTSTTGHGRDAGGRGRMRTRATSGSCCRSGRWRSSAWRCRVPPTRRSGRWTRRSASVSSRTTITAAGWKPPGWAWRARRTCSCTTIFPPASTSSGGIAQQLFERNKALYEAKWGEWILHAYRRIAMAGTAGRAPSTHPWTIRNA